MSYRERLFKISKKEYDSIKNLTVKGLESKYNMEYYEIYYNGLNKKELHTFGNDESNKVRKNKFFLNNDLNKLFNNSDTTLIKITKSELKNIIFSFIDRIRKGNKELLKSCEKLNSNYEPTSDVGKDEITKAIKREALEWESLLTIYYDDDDVFLDSWMINYDVFNLIYIYKHNDWKNNVLGIYGS